MKSLSVKKFAALLLGITVCLSMLSAQIPEKPQPPRLVNDFAGIFTPEQIINLETMLDRFSDSTSNQIAIVTMKDLGGYEPSQMAYEIGQKWGVGQSKFQNGVVVLIKPKNETAGQAFIATGYGLEGALPDAICKRIVEREMIPSFRENDYYGGVLKAADIIMKIASGEYKSSDYASKGGDATDTVASVFVIIFIIIMVIIMIARRGGPTNLGSGNRKGLSPWEALFLASMFSGGRRSGGGFGGFGGGSGGFGGGGFGGFGGGGFGGGGAGGSW
jgi:uncharacterized protein